MAQSQLTAIILTKNEERHIERCIESTRGIADQILVVDSFSTDKTVQLAEQLGARVIQNAWTNYATQFNFALSQLANNPEWVLRIDADEYITEQLKTKLQEAISGQPEGVNGIYLNRRMYFMGEPVRFGGVFPVEVLRVFRPSAGRCENRWMDEHIIVDGETLKIDGELIDDNLNSLTWWIDKHNSYASREAIDLLNLKYGFLSSETLAKEVSRNQDSRKRYIKEHIYARLPLRFRATLYFLYRYILRGGIFDRGSARSFHFLQGFWYRYLVDKKVGEVEKELKNKNSNIQDIIRYKLGIDP